MDTAEPGANEGAAGGDDATIAAEEEIVHDDGVFTVRIGPSSSATGLYVYVMFTLNTVIYLYSHETKQML